MENQEKTLRPRVGRFGKKQTLYGAVETRMPLYSFGTTGSDSRLKTDAMGFNTVKLNADNGL